MYHGEIYEKGQGIQNKATKRGRMLSPQYHEVPSLACTVTKRGEIGESQSYQSLLGTN